MITNSKEMQNVSPKVIFPELSYLVVGILYEVHKELGEYAREKQYGDLVEKKLKEKNILYNRELTIANSGNVLDFLIDNKIILELKSVREINKEYYRQLQNYLQQCNKKLGILVNFRTPHLRPIRVLKIELKNSLEKSTNKKPVVYLAGQSNEYENNWKELFKTIKECDFYDWEFDSDQTSSETFFPDDLNGIEKSDYLVANPGNAPSEATWIEVGYFYSNNIKKPGDFCDKLIIIWKDSRNPKWSIEFVKKAGYIVSSVQEAREKLSTLIRNHL